jgi:uncharacterized membrane protein HdeD (DUF308 family)
MSERRWQQIVWANVLAGAINVAFYVWLGHWWSLAAVAISTSMVIWFCATWRDDT